MSRKPASALKFPNIDGIFKAPLEREDLIPPPGTSAQPIHMTLG